MESVPSGHMTVWSVSTSLSGPEPLVSVIVPTYNHAAFLARALESVLNQEAEFPIEILVGNDASTDDTGMILDALVRKHPSQIRAYHARSNQGVHANFSNLYAAARGRYVAWIEGDDYWTDSAKLRLQVEFLEAHPEVVLSFHPVAILDDSGSVLCDATNQTDPELSGLERITRFNYVYTASVLFRNKVLTTLPSWMSSLPLGDWPLFILLAEHGKLALMHRTMAVYWKHAGGVWSSRSELSRLECTVQVAEICLKELGHHGLSDCIFKTSRTIARQSLEAWNLPNALRYFYKCLRVAITRPEILMEWRRKRARKSKRIRNDQRNG
jgi:glycosyltransferase involved in cell wall biosynthesis